MKTFFKGLVAGSLPVLVIGATVAAEPAATGPATQAATAPATQPAGTTYVDAHTPLVIPDGTSPENPGPGVSPALRMGGAVRGLRG